MGGVDIAELMVTKQKELGCSLSMGHNFSSYTKLGLKRRYLRLSCVRCLAHVDVICLDYFRSVRNGVAYACRSTDRTVGKMALGAAAEFLKS
jgi:hypothetical protein